ncbi:MAG: TetR/AcrR family transcriptional regulator [Rhodobacteraceae bacterium]|nr:TetR/AcrR family transcriptional regulator [Paracoccaceae bacterium]
MSSGFSKRDEKILRAALSMFARFGVAKTTMNDIASEAGVARQTVYNAFPGKPDLLRATTRLATRDFQEEVREAWSGVEGTAAKLDLYLELGPLRWYALIKESPATAEVFDGMNEHAKAEVAEGTKNWTAMMEAELKADGVRSKDPEVSLSDLSEFFYFASANAKYSAESTEILRARLRTIRSALLNMLEDAG